MANSVLAAGTLIGGDFVVERELAAGGMGAVYVAHQRSTAMLRALKVMLPELVRERSMRERFVQEARIGARIESDHVVQVIAAGIDEPTGMPWLAMELLKGMVLEDRLEKDGFLPLHEAAQVLAQVCHALGAAHAAGIVHRDLKPANVFLSQSRQVGVPHLVKILDFGVAKLLVEAGASMTVGIGTPLYMAPEQASSSREISPQTDVWAIGLLMFEMLVGRSYWKSAYERGSMLKFVRELTADPLPRATEAAARHGRGHHLPVGFDDWFEACVNRQVKGRFASADAAYAALERVLGTSRSAGASGAFAAIPHDVVPRHEPSHVFDAAPLAATIVWRPPAAPAPAAAPAPSPTPSAVTGPSPPLRGVDLRPETLHARYAEYVRRGQSDRAYCLAAALGHLGQSTPEQAGLCEARQRAQVPFTAGLQPSERERLLGFDQRDPLLFALLGAVATPTLRALVEQRRLTGRLAAPEDAWSTPASAPHAFARTYDGVSRLLAIAAAPLALRPDVPGSTRFEPSDPPTVVACAAALGAGSRREMAYFAARALMFLRPIPRVLAYTELATFDALVRGALGDPTARLAYDGLYAQLTDPERKRIESAARAVRAGGSTVDLPAFLGGLEHEAAHAGLLACDDLAIAMRLVAYDREPGSPLTPERRREELLAFAVSERHFEARERVGLGP